MCIKSTTVSKRTNIGPVDTCEYGLSVLLEKPEGSG